MVKFADAASNPETMVIKLADASVAVPAVPTPIGLYDETCFAEAPLRHLDFVDKLHALNTLFIIHFFDYDLRVFIILECHIIIVVLAI